MSIFGAHTTEGIEEVKDRLGGGFEVYDSGIYEATVKLAYAGKSNTAGSKSESITVLFDLDGKEYRETFWITNKEGLNYKVNDNNKKEMQAGFAYMDNLSLILTGNPLNKQATEEKMVKIYNFEQKKDIPESRHTLIDWEGKTITLALFKNLVNKQVKQPNGDYKDTADTRETNSIANFFDPKTRMTVQEAKSGKTTGEFCAAWEAKHSGKVNDRRKIKDGGSAGSAGAPGQAPAAEAAAPRQQLFGG